MRRPIIFLLIITLLAPGSTFALSSSFNPNFIISDEEMQDYQTMSRADIQAFLKARGGYLANYQAEDIDGKTRDAADIIQRAAERNKINPKYLLVKFQKEQSLVTDKDPTAYQLDWASGYGVCDSCDTDDPKLLKYKGFAKQADNAAGIIRWYYENVGEHPVVKQSGVTYQIDGKNVTPVNNATAFLYTYTPHLHGNENFWKIWQSWFEQVYPNGTIIKSEADSTVYLLQDGKKRAFASMAALTTRYDPKLALTVPDSELARYAPGTPISLPNFSVLQYGETYYLLDRDILRPFADGAVKALGYHPDEIIEVGPSDIDGLPISTHVISATTSAPLGRLVKIKETGSVYYITDTTYHPLFDEKIASVNFSHLKVETISALKFPKLAKGEPTIFKDGTLIGITGDNRIYVIENGVKRHITSEEVFTGLGWSWKNIVWTNPVVGGAIPDGESIYLREVQDESDTLPIESPPLPAPKPLTNSTYTSDKIICEIDDKTLIPGLLVKTPSTAKDTAGPTFETSMESYLIADAKTLEIKAGKNIEYSRPIASLTKVMTGLLALEKGMNLNGVTTYQAADQQAVCHGYNIAEGEKVRNSDLMYAMMLASSNTPARMIADSVEEDEKKFVADMNAKVASWGLKNTTFLEPTGLEVKNKSSAHDFLILFSKALKNAQLTKFMAPASHSYTEVLDLDNAPEHTANHTNKLMFSTLNYKILASKTGYLYEAGDCLAMLVERPSDGKQFIVITLGNPDHAKKFDAPNALTNWALKTF